jgi:hypothetical protein
MEWMHSNLALEGAHSTLEFNQNCEDFAKKREHNLEVIKLLVEKIQKCFEKQVNAKRREV